MRPSISLGQMLDEALGKDVLKKALNELFHQQGYDALSNSAAAWSRPPPARAHSDRYCPYSWVKWISTKEE